MQRAFRTFIGVDLGGGKGKTTAVARLRLCPALESGQAPLVVVEDYGGAQPWYDERLVEYLLRHAGPETVVAIDAPLTLTACVRCAVPVCPGVSACEVPVVRWFRGRGVAEGGAKPRYTPYTQRATEIHLHEDHGILPRETLGQGMGPLTARAAFLRRGLASAYTLNENLLEVYPKATLVQLFPDVAPLSGAAPAPRGPGVLYKDSNGQPLSMAGEPKAAPREGARRGGTSRVARHYKRSGHAVPVREQILHNLPDLRFGPGQWREFALQNDHQLDALLCAYTAFLWARDGWTLPADPVFQEDGWIWFPPQKAKVQSG